MPDRRARHQPGCGHCPRVRLLGLDFQTWRASWEASSEAAGYGYTTETRMYAAEHRPPTFRDYLVSMAGSGWPMSGKA